MPLSKAFDCFYWILSRPLSFRVRVGRFGSAAHQGEGGCWVFLAQRRKCSSHALMWSHYQRQNWNVFCHQIGRNSASLWYHASVLTPDAWYISVAKLPARGASGTPPGILKRGDLGPVSPSEYIIECIPEYIRSKYSSNTIQFHHGNIYLALACAHALMIVHWLAGTYPCADWLAAMLAGVTIFSCTDRRMSFLINLMDISKNVNLYNCKK